MFIGRLIDISEETQEGLEMRQGNLQEKNGGEAVQGQPKESQKQSSEGTVLPPPLNMELHSLPFPSTEFSGTTYILPLPQKWDLLQPLLLSFFILRFKLQIEYD